MDMQQVINQSLIYALEHNDFELARFCKQNNPTNLPYVIGVIVNNYKTLFNGDKCVMTKWLRMLNDVDDALLSD